MKFTKIIVDGYILGLAIANRGVEITEQEYNELTEIFHAMPTPREGYEYKLTVDREWVEVPLDTDPDLSDAESFFIIFGGDTE